MQIKVFLCGPLREVVGEHKIIVDLPDGSILRDLVNKLGEEFGDELKENLYPDSPLIIVVGGRDHRFAGGLAARLDDGEPVYLIPPAEGG